MLEHFLLLKKKKVLRRSLAYHLKENCHKLYYWDGLKEPEYYENNPNEKEALLPTIGKTVRQVWIEYGTLVGREIYHKTWIELLFQEAKNYDYLIIPDVRFLNEAKEILDKGGLLYKIERNIPPTDDLADRQLANFDGWTNIIYNNNPLPMLNIQMARLAERVK